MTPFVLNLTPKATEVRLLLVAAPLVVALMSASSASAQEAPRNFIGLGAISVPEFEGSADRTAVPFLVGRIDFGSSGSLRFTGTGAQYNLFSSDSPWSAGPLISLRAKRDADVKDPVIQQLREVDSAAEIGAFVEYGWRDTLTRGDRFGLGVEARGGEGTQAALTANYTGPQMGAWQFGADARLGWANSKHMDTYFSVDADNSARSGLPVFQAGSGVKRFDLGLNATYNIDQRWMLIGRLGFSRLQGDAADSPIVQQRGKANSTSIGLAVGYRF